MPSNEVTINGTIQWHVGDSKMENLIGVLNKDGERQPDISIAPSEIKEKEKSWEI